MSQDTTNTLRGHGSVALCAATMLLLLASPAVAKPTRCHLTYDVEGWSILYKVARGSGQIKCVDGQTANVTIVAHGGGLSLGTEKVKRGRGRFSGTEKITDLYGTYIEIDSHAGIGADASVDARAMFKGSKRLSLAGKGSGINLGFAIGAFTIKAR
jgi:hypothetical protein